MTRRARPRETPGDQTAITGSRDRVGAAPTASPPSSGCRLSGATAGATRAWRRSAVRAVDPDPSCETSG